MRLVYILTTLKHNLHAKGCLFMGGQDASEADEGLGGLASDAPFGSDSKGTVEGS